MTPSSPERSSGRSPRIYCIPCRTSRLSQCLAVFSQPPHSYSLHVVSAGRQPGAESAAGSIWLFMLLRAPSNDKTHPRPDTHLPDLSPYPVFTRDMLKEELIYHMKSGQSIRNVTFYHTFSISSIMVFPISAVLLVTFIPAPSMAAILSAAVPLPPEIMAPAWPILLPAGAVTPAM